MTNQELIATLQDLVHTYEWSVDYITKEGTDNVEEMVGSMVEEFMNNSGFNSEDEDLFGDLCNVVYDAHGDKLRKSKYDRHVEAVQEFYCEAYVMGEVNPAEQDIEDLAQCLWDDFEYATDNKDNPWDYINYSAGVLLGEIPEEYIVSELRNPDNLNIDAAETCLLIADSDRYGDAIEEVMQEYANKFFSVFGDNERAALAYIRNNEEKVSDAGFVTLKQRAPETFVAFLTNNPNYEYDELVKDFKSYAIIETLCGLLED